MFEIGRLTRLAMGYVSESNSRPIEICVADWLADWPGATIGLLLMRPGEDTYYPAASKVVDGVLHFTPSRADMAIPGDGLAQIVMTDENDVELRSRVVRTMIECSLPGSEAEAPEEPMRPFVDQVLEAAASAVESADLAGKAAGNAAADAGRAEAAADNAEAAAKRAEEAASMIGPGGGGTGTVTSVNGVQPDEAGNVEIVIPEPPKKLSELESDAKHRLVTDTEKAAWDAKSTFSGKYADLSGKPTIPTKLSEMAADASHRLVTDTEKSAWNAKSTFSGKYADLTGKPTIPNVPSWALQSTKPTYTAAEVGALPRTYTPPNQTAAQVGADPAGTAASKVSTHNADEDAHPAIRQLISDLYGRLSALADSDDTTLDQLSEIVAYIKSNKSLIDSITTGKVSTADIVNNLTSTATNKPLSAAQGKALKALIDAIVVPTKLSELAADATHRLTTDAEKAAWNAKSTFSGKYEDLTGKPTIPTVPTKVSQLTNDAGYIDDSTLAAELAKRGQLKPEFANSIEECTDQSKLYVLPDGYIYAYMYTEVTAEGGNNNLAVPKISTDTSDPDAWLEGYRFSTSSISAQSGGVITNRIPCKLGDTIYIKGLNVNVQLGSSYARIRPYNGTNVVNIGSLDAKGIIDNGYGTVNGDLITLRMVAEADPDYNMSSNAFDSVRLNGSYMSGYTADTVKITVNEEYKETQGGIVREYAWASTGHAFVPADYESRIVDLEEATADHESRLKLLEANENGNGVPAYWLEELESKADAIQQAMETAGRNKSAFLWYTDAHWPNNAKASPALLDYLIRNTPMNKVNFGGDIVGDPNPHSHDNIKYVYEWRKLIAGLLNHHSVAGNHDLNHNTTDVRDMAYAFLLAPEESPDVVMGGELYYYIDNPAEKTRYLYLDYMTSDHDAMTEQGRFVVDAIKGVDDGWHIVVIAHRWLQYTSASAPTVGSVPAYEKDILSVLDAYNARTSRAASNYFVTQDFSGAKGKVEFCIGGHIHVDYDFASDGGIPIILTASDTNQDRSSGDEEDSGTVGTTTEAAVYGIVADYTNSKIGIIGVGRGGSREISL